MQYIIKDEEGNDLFRIYPYDNELCWCIDEYALVKPKDKEPYYRWKFTEKYPTDLLLAFKIVRELMLKRDEQTIVNYSDLKRTLTMHDNRLLKAIKEAK